MSFTAGKPTNGRFTTLGYGLILQLLFDNSFSHRRETKLLCTEVAMRCNKI